METLKKIDLVLGVTIKLAKLIYWLVIVWNLVSTVINYRQLTRNAKFPPALPSQRRPLDICAHAGMH